MEHEGVTHEELEEFILKAWNNFRIETDFRLYQDYGIVDGQKIVCRTIRRILEGKLHYGYFRDIVG